MTSAEYDRKRMAAYYAANREAILARRRELYTPEKAEKDRARTKAWREANPDRAAEYQRQYYEANKEELRAKARERMRAYRAKEKQYGSTH